MSRNSAQPDTAIKTFQVAVAFDDTYTRVRVFTNEPFSGDTPVAEGKARRMKGDPRDPEVGLALATGRAFKALAKREFDFADQRLNPKPVEPVKQAAPEWLVDAFKITPDPEEGE